MNDLLHNRYNNSIIMQLFMRRPDLKNLAELSLPAGYTLHTNQPKDRDGLATLLDEAFTDRTWTAQGVQDALIEPIDVVQTFLIFWKDEIVATASARVLPQLYPESGYVHWVASSPSHRGLQLGRMVSLAVLREFVKLGCRDAVLETDDNRLAAINTYLKLGFRPESRHASHPARWKDVFRQLNLEFKDL